MSILGIPEVAVGDDRAVVVQLRVVVSGTLLAVITAAMDQSDHLVVVFRLPTDPDLTHIFVAALRRRG